MKILKGEILQNDVTTKTAKMHYHNEMGFFIALVTICDQLDIDVPIWTIKEERLLEKKQEVVMWLEKNIVLKIYEEPNDAKHLLPQT